MSLNDLSFRAVGYFYGEMRGIRTLHIFKPGSLRLEYDNELEGNMDVGTTLCGLIYRPGMKFEGSYPVIRPWKKRCSTCEKLVRKLYREMEATR